MYIIIRLLKFYLVVGIMLGYIGMMLPKAGADEMSDSMPCHHAGVTPETTHSHHHAPITKVTPHGCCLSQCCIAQMNDGDVQKLSLDTAEIANFIDYQLIVLNNSWAKVFRPPRFFV